MPSCKDCVAMGLLGVCDDYCREERQVLTDQARQSAEQRGHTLTEFIKVKDYAVWEARCVHCGQQATINLDPPPNGADVYGEATTATCPQSQSEQRPDDLREYSQQLRSTVFHDQGQEYLADWLGRSHQSDVIYPE
jgi:hypothetical protein